MDVVSSILNSMEGSSSSLIKNKELSSDLQKEQRSFKCNMCRKFFPSEDFLLHNLSHFQGSTSKDELKNTPKNDTTSQCDKKPSYKCPDCGKIYTELKPFDSHKNNHRRNKKLKDLGVHPRDKEGCLKLKASAMGKTSSTDKAMGTIVSSEMKQTYDNGSNFEMERDLPVKLLINPDVIANPMLGAGDWTPPEPVKSDDDPALFPPFHLVPEDSYLTRRNPPVQNTSYKYLQKEQCPFKCNMCRKFFPREDFLRHNLSHCQGSTSKEELKNTPKGETTSQSDKKPSYKCPVCGKIYTERKLYVNHKNNHRRNKKLKDRGVHPSDKEGCVKLKASATGKTSSTDKAIGTFVSSEMKQIYDIGGNFEMEADLPVKLLINPNVIANPMLGTGDWTPPEPVKSDDDASAALFPPFHLVPEDSFLTKRNPPVQNASYKCKICGKAFTEKKTFLNHKYNHKQKKDKLKLLFYDRGSKKKEGKSEKGIEKKK